MPKLWTLTKAARAMMQPTNRMFFFPNLFAIGQITSMPMEEGRPPTRPRAEVRVPTAEPCTAQMAGSAA